MCANCQRPDDDDSKADGSPGVMEIREFWPLTRIDLVAFARWQYSHGDKRLACQVLAAVALADVGAEAED